MVQDAFDVNKLITSMNTHVPSSRRSLLDYMESDALTYRTRGNDICEIDRKEIDYLASVCSEIEKMQLRLPIFVSTDVSGESPAWKVDGTVESKIVARILGRTQFRPDSVRFYHPDYKKLLGLLPTSVIVLFIP